MSLVDFVPSPFRFVFRSVPSGTNKPLARELGRAFKAIRVHYRLTAFELADGWRVSAVQIAELEEGLFMFKTPADLDSGLRQLWIWAMEKSKGEIGK